MLSQFPSFYVCSPGSRDPGPGTVPSHLACEKPWVLSLEWARGISSPGAL